MVGEEEQASDEVLSILHDVREPPGSSLSNMTMANKHRDLEFKETPREEADSLSSAHRWRVPSSPVSATKANWEEAGCKSGAQQGAHLAPVKESRCKSNEKVQHKQLNQSKAGALRRGSGQQM